MRYHLSNNKQVGLKTDQTRVAGGPFCLADTLHGYLASCSGNTCIARCFFTERWLEARHSSERNHPTEARSN